MHKMVSAEQANEPNFPVQVDFLKGNPITVFKIIHNGVSESS